jgi:hypothetical protein
MEEQMKITDAVHDFSQISYPGHRYSSFDFCYNYFRSNDGNAIINDMEKSCAILGFYLASWGMMRGSSFLLQKSYRHFTALIEWIASVEREYWQLEPSAYSSQYSIIEEAYNKIRNLIIEDSNRDIVLVSKILLGVFGIVPAFDEYFCKCFKKIDPEKSRFTVFNKDSLEVIQSFYLGNKEEIDRLSAEIFTKDFITSECRFNYPKAKIIDMYGFVVGTKE